MKILTGSIFLILSFIWSSTISPEEPATHIIVSDSVKIEIHAYDDGKGLPYKYGARIYTPVCEGNKCYAIEIDIYWDCIGRFHHYDSIPGKGLTKLDHIPFTASDYLKLGDILNSPNSLLGSYAKEELVRDTRSSRIDGLTGATINEIKESVIGGAVYSCYTLWHIVHGSVTDSIQMVTVQNFSKEFVQKLVARQDQEINRFLIDHFSENDFPYYSAEILEMLQDGKGYFAKNALETLPDDFIHNPLSQKFFAENFNQFDYFTQVALLERLRASALGADMKTVLQKQAHERKDYKTELIRSLLSDALLEME